MTSIRNAQSEKLVMKTKEELKKVEAIKPAPWMRFVKSGSQKDRPPVQDDFWYIRAASILRRIYLDGPVGVSRLRSFYGGRQQRGYQHPIAKKSAGNHLRKIMQQLETAGFIKKEKGGRVITSKGRQFLDKIAKGAKDA